MIVALALLFWSSFTLQSLFSQFVDVIGSFIEHNFVLGLFLFLILAALSAMISPFSSVPLVPLVISLWGKTLTSILLILGWSLGDAIAYLIGSWAGYAILKKYYSVDKIEYYKNKIPSRSQFWLVILFRIAVPAEITGYTLGIVRYSFAKFMLAVFLTGIPYALVTIYSSIAIVEKRPFLFFSTIALGLIVFGLAIYFFRKNIKKQG